MGNPEGRMPLGKRRIRWEEGVKIYLLAIV
jgi:hypothetical protein